MSPGIRLLQAAFFVAAPIIGAAQPKPVPVNDGTGPWVGVGISPGMPISDSNARALDAFESRVSEFDRHPTRLEAAKLTTLATTLKRKLSSTSTGSSSSQFLVGEVQTALTSLSNALNAWDLAEVKNSLQHLEDDLRSSKSLVEFETGISFQRQNTFNFETLGIASNERLICRATNTRSVGILSGTFVDSIGSNGSTLKRVGVGGLYGNPDLIVADLNIGSYFTPTASDVIGQLSGRVAPGPGADDKRRLVDYVASGDIWLTGNVRRLAGSTPGSTAAAYEGEFTCALPQRFYNYHGIGNPLWSTTINLYATYCSEHIVGLDEYAFEVRAPIFSVRLEEATPVYLALRYGTQGNFTATLALRL
jgi:hypothetical protein